MEKIPVKALKEASKLIDKMSGMYDLIDQTEDPPKVILDANSIIVKLFDLLPRPRKNPTDEIIPVDYVAIESRENIKKLLRYIINRENGLLTAYKITGKYY